METNQKNSTHVFFEAGIILKGLDGLLEIIGGLLLLVIKPETINKTIAFLTQHELSQDPKDFIANYFLKIASHISPNSILFASIYLFSHGIVKIIIILSLLAKKLWAYPTAIIFFTFFIIYQLYRFAITHSLWLILLSIFDILIIILTWLEYKRLKKSQ